MIVLGTRLENRRRPPPDFGSRPIRAEAPAAVPGRWIVQLTAAATDASSSSARAQMWLDAGAVDFQVLRGLGLPGQLLVQARGGEEIQILRRREEPERQHTRKHNWDRVKADEQPTEPDIGP
jgi:hypothetical protein